MEMLDSVDRDSNSEAIVLIDKAFSTLTTELSDLHALIEGGSYYTQLETYIAENAASCDVKLKSLMDDLTIAFNPLTLST